MKILVFSDRDIKHPFSGGSMINIHEQAKRWVSWGHQVTMITTKPKGSSRRDTMDGVEVYLVGNRYTVYLLAPLLYLVSLRNRANVVLDIINGIPFCTPLFSRKPKVGLMHHVHREMFLIELGPLLGRLGLSIERYMVPLLYRNVPVITVSQSSMKQLRELLHRGDMLDIRLVYNGIDHQVYHGDGNKFARPTVLCLGRVKRYKQIPRLICMMPAVRREVPDVELIIAGGGDAADEVEQEIERLGVGDFVQYRGFVSEEEKLRLYSQAWVMATPSLIEGWGLTVMEANACGTPAVAFNAPGLNESIVNDRNGLLASDDRQFVKHLIDILKKTSLRQRLEAGAVKRADEFNWDDVARQSLEVLEEAVASRP